MLRARTLASSIRLQSLTIPRTPVVLAPFHSSTRTMGANKNHDQVKSHIPQPPPGAKENQKKPFPDTGWEGDLPSSKGGEYEKDFMQKPPYRWESDKFEVKYTSSCWCGKVAFEFHGDPISCKHCHCLDCQKLHGAPFQHAALYPKTSVRLSKNENDSLDFFSTEEHHSAHHVPCKVACTNCRSPMFDEGKNMVLAYPGSFDFKDHVLPHAFHASSHIFYGQRSFDIPDGVPKWKGHEWHSELMPEVTEETNVMGSQKRPLEDSSGEEINLGSRAASDAEESSVEGAGHDERMTDEAGANGDEGKSKKRKAKAA